MTDSEAQPHILRMEELRAAGKYGESDKIRLMLLENGLEVRNTRGGTRILKKKENPDYSNIKPLSRDELEEEYRKRIKAFYETGNGYSWVALSHNEEGCRYNEKYFHDNF
uniref:Uncharacterized protein n=1 Tax=viral metagenome TaxID=1070528 RepID=A0A6M3L0J2_9ZZZZ